MRTVVELIAAKRDGSTLDPSDIQHLIDAYMDGSLADYQMSAFLMAAFLRGLSDSETVALTQAMLRSGSILQLPSVNGPKVDKHSTGGVGDKVSICLAPLVAACGVFVPMVSGRGLGHTGGTLDKLEAIPGFRTNLSATDFARIVGDVGTCMIGQTAEIAPADKRIYALRDVTATVECIPLIVASILSKKLAEGIDSLVLDVKVGKGAFMKDVRRAEELAKALVRVGEGAGKKVVALLTDMDAPLGLEIGNANETREALEILHGKGPTDLLECTLLLGIEMLMLGGRANSPSDAREKLKAAIASGTALEVMEKMVAAQGGDSTCVRTPDKLKNAPVTIAVRATRSGFIADLNAHEVGLCGVALGAGRTRADQAVDPLVGITLLAKPGEEVKANSEIAHIHVRKTGDADRIHDRLKATFVIADEKPADKPLFLARVHS